MSDADVFKIDNCILEDKRVKDLKENTAEWFMFKNSPVLFLRYLNFQRKDLLPTVGSKVVTLRSGFGGYHGCTRYISEINEKYIILVNTKDDRYLSNIRNWYNDFFEL